VRIGLATIQHGRRHHLERQAAMVADLAELSRYLVVTMDGTAAPPGAERLDRLAEDPDRLPLAAARNAAVAHLADCDLVVLLDVDCLPDPGLLVAYRECAGRVGADRALLMGPVGWLDQPVPAGGLDASRIARARGTVKRDFPERGLAQEPRPELFWSLSFAVSPSAHRQVGGFDEAYTGWGAEDTDYGRRARAGGLGLWKVGGAWAYHQPHPPARSRPGQVAALADNALRYHARWGDWPMPDVLAELAGAGQIAWVPGGSTLRLTPEPDQAAGPGDGGGAGAGTAMASGVPPLR
jgi:N-acetylglucosaminyl-diphospho-decaprenol L-rhamnosyltransferase